MKSFFLLVLGAITAVQARAVQARDVTRIVGSPESGPLRARSPQDITDPSSITAMCEQACAIEAQTCYVWTLVNWNSEPNIIAAQNDCENTHVTCGVRYIKIAIPLLHESN
jgi:hypothetical protein